MLGKLANSVVLSLILVGMTPEMATAGSGEGYTATGGCTASGATVVCNASVGGSNGAAAASAPAPSPPRPVSHPVTTGAASPPPLNPLSCSYKPLPYNGPPPAGRSGAGRWEALYCNGMLEIYGAPTPSMTAWMPNAIWVPVGQVAPTPTAPSPGILAEQAAAQLPLPAPVIGMSPSGTGYVNLPEWLWIDPAMWHPFSMTVSASNALGTTSVTATAIPMDVVWQTGDGAAPTICDGPGVAWNPGLPPTAQSSSCAHVYTRSSIGMPSPDGQPNDASFTVMATIQWEVQWAGTGGTSGTVPSMTTAASASLRVAQIEAATCDRTCPPSG